jgi:hypothetical protein
MVYPGGRPGGKSPYAHQISRRGVGGKSNPYSMEGRGDLLSGSMRNAHQVARTTRERFDLAGGQHGVAVPLTRARYDKDAIDLLGQDGGQPRVFGMNGAGRIGDDSYVSGHPLDKLANGGVTRPSSQMGVVVDNWTQKKNEQAPLSSGVADLMRRDMGGGVQQPIKTGRHN